MINDQLLANVTAAYIGAIEFTDMGPDSDIPSGCEIGNGVYARCRRDCCLFMEAAGDLLDGADAAQIGYDFWLTRNGHGCGFWDGDWPEAIGAKLTELSERFGGVGTFQGSEDLCQEDNWFLYRTGEDFKHKISDWRDEVLRGNVLSGYYDWVESRIEQETV